MKTTTHYEWADTEDFKPVFCRRSQLNHMRDSYRKSGHALTTTLIYAANRVPSIYDEFSRMFYFESIGKSRGFPPLQFLRELSDWKQLLFMATVVDDEK